MTNSLFDQYLDMLGVYWNYYTVGPAQKECLEEIKLMFRDRLMLGKLTLFGTEEFHIITCAMVSNISTMVDDIKTPHHLSVYAMAFPEDAPKKGKGMYGVYKVRRQDFIWAVLYSFEEIVELIMQGRIVKGKQMLLDSTPNGGSNKGIFKKLELIEGPFDVRQYR